MLRALVAHFERLGRAAAAERRGGGGGRGAASDELRAIEGTVLYNLNFAVKQDHSLGNVLVRCVRQLASGAADGAAAAARTDGGGVAAGGDGGGGGAPALTPFALAALLAMARIARFEDEVLDLLKHTIVEARLRALHAEVRT